VNEGGLIHADEKGYPAKKGPGAETSGNGNGGGATHGGSRDGGTHGSCYGSVRHPVTLGSGGCYASGGGAVRLTVASAATIHGTISVRGASTNDRTGSGGSIWLSAASLAGGGLLRADGMDGVSQDRTPGCGGRLSVILTGEGQDFADFDAAGGRTTAYGGYNGSKVYGGAGTVYRETAAQGAARGTLIIDNRGKNSGYAGFTSGVTDADVGDVIIRNGGNIRFEAGGHLTVYGDFTNGGTVSANAADGTLEFAGTGTSRITGQNTVGSFVCTAPDKTLVFDANANNALTLYTGGALRLEGAEGHPVTLLGSPDDTAWHLSLGSDVTTPIFYAAVSNSVSDAAVTAKKSSDLGGNVNWSFPGDRNPGDPIVWTGAVSAKWGDVANWNPVQKPEETDSVFIRTNGEEGQFMPVLTEGTTLLNNLTIESGASLTLSGANLTVTNAFSTVGTGQLRATGTERISFSATNVTFASASGFSAGSSRVTLCAAVPQIVDAHGARFYRLTVGGAEDVTFASDIAADDFRATATADRTLSFAAGALLTAGRLDLRGLIVTDDVENPYYAALTICGVGADDVWRLKAENANAVVVKGVRVVNSNAASGQAVKADATCVNVTPATNAGWNFGEALTIDWTGASSSAFGTAANWYPAKVPGANDRAVISCVAGVNRTVTFDTVDYPVGALEVGGGEDGGTVSITVKNPWRLGFLDVRANATMTLAMTGTLSVTGNAIVRSGGTVTHERNPNTMTTLNNLSYKLVMEVAGDLLIEDDGQISAENKGFATGKGPGCVTDNYCCTAYGGKCTESTVISCYGSVVNPHDAGSGGKYTPGSGVVDLTVGGTLTVNGTVCSGGVEEGGGSRLGSAGSVLVHAGRLAGSGTIHANGCSCWWTEGRAPAAGGRVAVYLTAAGATFDAFEQAGGKVTAYGGSSKPSNPSTGYWNGAGTVYLAKPGEGLNGQVIIDNGGHKGGWTELPIPVSLNGDTLRTVKNFRLTVRNGGRLNVVGDLFVSDVDMATSDSTLDVNTNVLTITTSTHRNRRGWDANCTVTSNCVGTVWGRVQWRVSGMAIIIR